MKCHEKPSIRSRVVPCGLMDRQTDRQADVTMLIVDFRHFANAPKSLYVILPA